MRVDLGFDKYLAAVEKQNAEWQLNDEFKDADGNRQIRRTTKLIYKENPVPRSVRSMVGDGEFSFTVSSTFWPDLFDEAHPMAFKTELPFFADRISIEGLHWVEPVSATQCKLCARVDIKVRVTGISSQVEKAIEKGCKEAYAALPKHAEAYVALGRAALVGTPAKPSLGATALGPTASRPLPAAGPTIVAVAALPADVPPAAYVPPPACTHPASPVRSSPTPVGVGAVAMGAARQLSLSPSTTELQQLAAQAKSGALPSTALPSTALPSTALHGCHEAPLAPLASLRQRTVALRSSLQEAEQQLAREESASRGTCTPNRG